VHMYRPSSYLYKIDLIFMISYSEKGKTMSISYEDFERVDLRSGKIIKAEAFQKAKKPAYKVWVDFGPQIGVKQTSAQITHHYTLESLIGKSVIGCVNLGQKNIAGFISEFLLVGFPDEQGQTCLATVDQHVPTGQKLH
jgi:tRNA-binding protein